MSDPVFERLADALDRLPNGYPRTASRVELRILEKIFSTEDALIAGYLTGEFEPIDVIAARAGLPPADVKAGLNRMSKLGQVWFYQHEGKLIFRLAPFVVGIYEAQVDVMDHELAHLVENYMLEGGAAGIMGIQPALHRVIPTQGTVKSEWILPYDNVRAILLNAKSYHVGDCICRAQQDQIGRKCTYPLKMCLSFSAYERPAGPDSLTQEQALALLDQTEEIGLVHTVSNVREGMGYICNCCGCCCAILRGITEWGIQDSVAYANYFAAIDDQECLACGTCIPRCQVGAISEKDGISVIDRARCIGCGLCVSACPNDAVHLQLKPESEIIHPPADFSAWEHERLHNRGLIA